MQVRRLRDAAAFIQRAGTWLMGDEARNNLMLSLADRLNRGSQVYDQPAYFAVVESEGGVAGCIVRTPPFKLLVSELPADAIDPIVADVGERFDSLPAVLGPESAAAPVAQGWAAAHGLSARRGQRQRIYQLESVTPPIRIPAGSCRVATAADLDLVGSWIELFSEEVKMPTRRSRMLAEERIVRSELFLWIDQAPRAMLGWAGRTPNGIRIGYVYTPLEYRGRGYASALTAQGSQRALDAGYKFCFLFTDLSNPTSNAIYQRLGYRPVADVVDWVIE